MTGTTTASDELQAGDQPAPVQGLDYVCTQSKLVETERPPALAQGSTEHGIPSTCLQP